MLGDNKAFTLIELIVVMAIVAVLVLLAAPRFLGYTKDANVTAMQQDTKVLSDAVEMYHVDEGEWPIDEGSEPTYLGYGGVANIYPIDELKLNKSIKNIKGKYDDYGVAIEGEHKGQVFHVEGVKSNNDELVFGGNLKLTDYSARPKPQTEPNTNIITNGDGDLGTNENFNDFTFDSVNRYNGKPSFYHNGGKLYAHTDTAIPVDTELEYTLSYAIKGNSQQVLRSYGMVVPLDIDNKKIQSSHTMYISNTLTTLAKDLKRGDTVVHLTNARNWINEAGNETHKRKLIFWNYPDSTGYTYPPETYSRHISTFDTWEDGAIDYDNNTIKLNRPWNREEHKAGTKVSNGSSGGTYKYIADANSVIPSEWTIRKGHIQGVDYSGENVLNKFPPATKSLLPGFRLNRFGDGEVWLSNVQLTISED